MLKMLINTLWRKINKNKNEKKFYEFLKEECKELNFMGVKYYYVPGLEKHIACNYKDIIMVSDDFYKLSTDTQLFTLMHELGHKKLGHSEDNKKSGLTKEFEADNYAAQRVGYAKAFQAMKEVEAFAAKEYNTTSNVFSVRMSAINEKSKQESR